MAEVDPFNPLSQEAPDPNNLRSQWDAFLGDPRAQATMLQIGLNLMQPVGLGQTALGHLGQSVGSGGEVLSRQAEMDRKQQETDSKVTQREAAATLAESRAANAGTRSSLAEERLRHQSDLLDFRRTQLGTQSLLKAQGDYNRHVANIQKLNAKEQADAALFKREPKLQPIPTWNDFAAQRGLDPTMGGVVPGSNTTGDRLQGAPTGSSDPAADSIPDAPPNPKLREVGVTYNTPQGPLRWTGTGWVK